MDETTRRDQWVGTIFSTWVVIGLFLDGWAHNAGKPEDFFTPYHAVLYSGLVVGAIFYARERQRRRREGLESDSDPLMLAGFGLFALAGVGDGIWHTIFGVEEDLAALLSPTHLALMGGGLLLVSGPIRRARALPATLREELAGRWRTFLPVLAAAVLTVSVVAFFLQFTSAFHIGHPEWFSGTSVGHAHDANLGVASVLLTNGLLLGGLAWLLAAWPKPPFGAVTVYLGVTAVLLSGLLAFDYVLLVTGPLLAGVAADAALARGAGRRQVLTVVPLLLWSLWFAVFHVRWGIGWEVELWTGAIVFAVLTGVGLDLLVNSRETAEVVVPPTMATDPDPIATPMRVQPASRDAVPAD